MKVVFISNYLTHHQLPFSEAMESITNHNYYFIAEEPMEEERINMGWKLKCNFDYVIKTYASKENYKKALSLINDADLVISEGKRYNLYKERIRQNKLTFIYSERIYKNKYQVYKFPVRVFTHYFKYGRYKSLYLLCASAFAASDYAKSLLFLNKAYKWGYFPETKSYEIKQLMENKEKNSILWVGRFIDWKHPEKALKVAKKLKDDGINFKLRFIGNGPLEEDMKQLSKAYNLEDNVEFLGSMSPEEVRSYMETSQIFLFTSDKGEGWGAVLNESMNSGCAVIADKHIGAAPYLIKANENGLLYNGRVSELYKKTKYLLGNKKAAETLGQKAYCTIVNEWNAQVAAERLLSLSENLINKKETDYLSGPCSKH